MRKGIFYRHIFQSIYLIQAEIEEIDETMKLMMVEPRNRKKVALKLFLYLRLQMQVKLQEGGSCATDQSES